jgi:hypothetical protein
MPAVVSDRNYRQILSTAMAYRTREVQDLVFNSNPLSALLRERGRYKSYSGPEIRVTLQIDKLGGQWFSGYDYLDIQPKEILNDAVFTPKNLFVGFSLTGTELLANEGRTRIYNLMDEYMETADSSMRDLFEAALHGNGTGDAGRQMVGMGGALPINATTGTYGGIDRAANAIWRTTTYSVPGGDFPDLGTTFDSTTARPILERVVALRSKGRRHAELMVADLAAYQAYSASLVAHQRIAKADGGAAALGFDTLEIVTPAGRSEMVCATGVGNVMPANTIYGLDLDGLALYYHPSRNMVPLFPGDGAQPINQDAVAQGLVWNGELVVSNPRFMWRLITA